MYSCLCITIVAWTVFHITWTEAKVNPYFYTDSVDSSRECCPFGTKQRDGLEICPYPCCQGLQETLMRKSDGTNIVKCSRSFASTRALDLSTLDRYLQFTGLYDRVKHTPPRKKPRPRLYLPRLLSKLNIYGRTDLWQ